MVKVTLWAVTAREKHDLFFRLSSTCQLPSEPCSYYPVSTWGEKADAEASPILHSTSQMYLLNILRVEIGFGALKPWRKRKISYWVSIVQVRYKYLPSKIPFGCCPISLLPSTTGYIDLALVNLHFLSSFLSWTHWKQSFISTGLLRTFSSMPPLTSVLLNLMVLFKCALFRELLLTVTLYHSTRLYFHSVFSVWHLF